MFRWNAPFGLRYDESKARRAKQTVKLCLEVLEDRTVLSTTSMESFSAVASPPAAPEQLAAVTSFMASTINQYAHLLVTFQIDVLADALALSQEIAQAESYAVQQWGRIFGYPVDASNQVTAAPVQKPNSGSGRGSGAMTTGYDAPNQPLNNSPQQAGHGSGGVSTATQPISSGHGFMKVHPLDSGSGSGSSLGIVNISGEVWLDNDGDNSLDNGEMGFQGITVDLWSGGNLVTQATTTSAPNGVNYLFAIPVYSQSTPFQIEVMIPSGDFATSQGPNCQVNSSGFSAVYNLAPGGAVNVSAGLKSMNVTTNQDDPGGPIKNQVTLRDAIETGNNGPPAPAVTFSPSVTGTIALQKALDPIQEDYDINGPGSSVLTVQGSGGPGNAYRIFTINAGIYVSIHGLTISGGYDESGKGGGGILNYAQLGLDGDVLSGNFTAADGGAILNSSGASLKLYGINQIQNNAAAVDGGGIANYGTVSILGDTTQIISNEAQGGDGGGIYNLYAIQFNYPGTAVQIEKNTALFDGGGVYNGAPSGRFTMGRINSDFANNSTGQNGGGLYNNATATLDGGLGVSSNTASNQGGGLYLDILSTTTLNTITVKGNTAPTGNGIYLVNGGKLTYTNLTDPDDPGGKPVQGR